MSKLPFYIIFLILILPLREASASLPKQAFIKGITGRKQTLSLSCESRSAVDWAAYWGVKIGEKKFMNKLPRSDNPDMGFVGNPNDAWGNIPPASYGVHAKPVAALLQQYGLDAQARKHMGWEELKGEIAASRPVIVWVIGQMTPGKIEKIKTKDGKWVTVARYEHTMLVVGYDANNIYVIDAYTGNKQNYSKRAFLRSWSILGNMAITGGIRQKVLKPVAQPTPLADEKMRVFMPFAAFSP
ncbi:MAG: C39 family peptidase [Anaerolineales bacterium]|nr:C39 family peptidase [Anaerolineales bacterium]